ncbi:MAG: SDR family oxidoreductase [Fimbriimonadaceae bacterium]
MHVIVLGAKGQLGRRVVAEAIRRGLECTAFDRKTFGFATLDSVPDLPFRKDTVALINCAAFTQVEQAEDEPELAMRVNADAPGWVAIGCKQAGVRMIHFSTDFVFSSPKRFGLAREDDHVDPINAYGKSKAEGDLKVLAAGGNHRIFRVSSVYSADETSFFGKIVKRARAGQEIQVVGDRFSQPTPANAIALFVVGLVAEEREIPSPLYHLVPDDCVSWYDFAKAALVSQSLEEEASRIIKIDSLELREIAKRPQVSFLSNRLAKEELELGWRGWKTLLDVSVKDPLFSLSP